MIVTTAVTMYTARDDNNTNHSEKVRTSVSTEVMQGGGGGGGGGMAINSSKDMLGGRGL